MGKEFKQDTVGVACLSTSVLDLSWDSSAGLVAGVLRRLLDLSVLWLMSAIGWGP